MDKENPLVSVIIPSLDGFREGNVPRLLKQISEQTFKDLEVMVIKGVRPNGRARNEGARKARGEILIFFDDDVTLGHERIIEILVKTLKEEKKVGLLGISKQLPPDSNRFQRLAARELSRSTSPIYDTVTDGDLVDHMCLCVYKDLFFKIGLENENLVRGTDPDLRYRVRKAGLRITLAPGAWAYHPLPPTLKALLKVRFANGAGSAWVYRHYPELATHDAESHQTPFREKTTLPYRILNSLKYLFLALITFRFILLLARLSYHLGYLWGFINDSLEGFRQRNGFLAALAHNMERIGNISRKELNRFIRKPTDAIIEITHRCNLRCQMCGVWRKLEKVPARELSREEWERFIKEAWDFGIRRIGFAGGEPLLRGDIKELTLLIKKLGIYCGFFTNGTLLDREAAGWIIDNKVDEVHVSIDGLSVTHDKIRQKEGTFELAQRGIRNIIELKKERHVKYPYIDVHCTISRLNVSEIIPLAEWAKKEGVNFAFQIFSEALSGENDMTGEAARRYQPQKESLRVPLDKVKELKENIRSFPRTFFSRLILGLRDEDIAQSIFPIKRCYVSHDYLFIDPYGQVFPCTNFDGEIMGNIREKSMKEIWQGENFKSFRRNLKKKLYPCCRHCCHLSHNLTAGQVLKLYLTKKV